MKEPENTSAAIVEIGSTRIAIKAKRDSHAMNPSGWSIIAFAPSASVRCVRVHQPEHLELFIRSIMALAEGYVNPLDHRSDSEWKHHTRISDAIHQITEGEFDARRGSPEFQIRPSQRSSY